jgi:tRNA(Ile)-lysidine synthase
MEPRPPGEPQRKRIESQVRRFALDHGLLPPQGRLLLAVSGGPDSTALLLITARLAKNLGLKPAVAHFDHGLRGRAAAQQEAAFARSLAESLTIPFYEGSGDVRRLARTQRLSLEDAARRARYEFLASVAQREGYPAVATGHTASDQAETVLLHLVRGAGLDGLAGMAARSTWPFPHTGLSLVRPLLTLSRQQTLAYCAAADVTPLEDESNVSRDFGRNRVRNEVLPLLRELNPRIEDALVRLAGAAAEDTSYLRSVASQALLPSEDESQRLSRGLLSEWPSSPRRHALRLAFAALAGNAQDLTQRHILALERLLLEGKTGDRLDLPRDVAAVLQRDSLQLRHAFATRALPDARVRLDIPGRAVFGPLAVEASFSRPAAGRYAAVDAAALGDRACVRRRQPGDRFQPLGMSEAKKLQDFLVDAHVPREERDLVPLFVTPRGIVWAGGLRIAEWAKPRPGAATVYLSYRPV